MNLTTIFKIKRKENKMAGYNNFSESNNMTEAKSDGRLPASLLAKRIKRFFKGVTAKAIAETLHSNEWHHSSKRYNIVNVYDIRQLGELEVRRYLRKKIKELKQPKPKTLYFKSWNFNEDTDPRHWQWSITSRHGNNCFYFETIKPRLNKILENLLSETPKTDFQKGLKNKRIEVLNAILSQIKI